MILRKDLFLLTSSSCAEESCLSNVASGQGPDQGQGQGPGPDPDSWNLSFYLIDLYQIFSDCLSKQKNLNGN